ncbi:type II toxin-antitoxin system PemK/MazF family toxin [Streptomyces sp. J2-1]|uniref:type II toxin-antitoxin system PemK/MazF family toxin n=1 Tax=Streptomyces corallincola TaxID=2851888 RepID=UPI001C390996|nr:type II toxin-antitoxin system PemK/MazF family toxin [Streptomyces corallincola]MBV2354403.1 type II toxin-antitoxin system PemK/MazF family toxin [Streptomyces corallincola]
MDTSWWLALGAVVLLALLASLIDGWGRGHRSRRRRRASRPPSRPRGRDDRRTTATRPSPGDIWWAEVPYEDRPESKDRPCLVLAVRGDRATVAKITSRNQDARPGAIPLPPGAVDDARGRPSFLRTDELREVPVADFRRRAGTLDPDLWKRLRHLAD